MYLLRTLGELSLTRAEGADGNTGLSNSKALLILAWLATRPDRAARREVVAEFLWPGVDRSKALRALRQALFFLSQHADDILVRSDDMLRLDPSRIRVDLWDFETAIREGDYGRAVELYRGRFASGLERKVGVEAEHWIEEENSRLLVAVEVAYSKRIAEALKAGHRADAERLARAFAAMNPLDEDRHVTLVRTLKAVGDDVGALRAFEAYRQVIRQDQGDEPPAELAATMERLRAELTAPLSEQAAADAPRPERRKAVPVAPRRYSRDLIVAAGLLAGAILAATVVLGNRTPAAPELAASLETTVLGAVERAGESRLVEVRLGLGTVETRDAGLPFPFSLPAPDGDRIAFAEQASTGWNLALREGRGARSLTTMAGDEFPVAWSPDGSFLLFAHRRLRGDGTPSHRLYVLDIAADTARLLSTLESRGRPSASWSPDGTQIAFSADVGREPDVFVIDFDGGDLRNLTQHPGADMDPAWAPDRSRIAFVSRRREDANLYAIRPDGTDLRELTQLTEDEASPVWTSSSTLLFLAGGDQPEVWALDMTTAQAVRLGPAVGFHRLVSARRQPGGWIDQVRIQPRLRVGSPGQHVTLGVEAVTSAGSSAAFPRLPLRWLVVDPAVADVRDGGVLRLLAPGTTALVLSAGGWRSDTLALAIFPLVESELQPRMTETWEQGLVPARWRAFGDPKPAVVPAPGRHPVLLNKGDAFFESGVISQEPIPLGNGVTIEAQARIGFTGKVHQEFGLAILPAAGPDSALEAGHVTPVAAFRVRGPSEQDPGGAAMITPEDRLPIPLLESSPLWRTFALQLQPGGPLQLIVDGKLHWQSPTPLPRNLPEQGWLVLGFQSFETDIAHGTVRVYPGIKYRLPE